MVREETGAAIAVTGIIGAYGGRPMIVEYPNGDRVAYVTTAFECRLLSAASPDMDEILEIGWFPRDRIAHLLRREWIDRVFTDVSIA